MLLHTIVRIILYSMVGLALLLLSIFHEIINGTGMTHPVWNREYDWMPTITFIMLGAATLALLRSLLESLHLSRRLPARIAVVADLGWGKEHQIAVRAR